MKTALIAIAALLVAAPAQAAGRHHVIHAQLGKVRAELSYDQISPMLWEHSRLRIWRGTRLLVSRPVGAYAPLYGSRPISVRQLDGVGEPEVLLTEFTGGNGCCYTNWIYAGARRIRAPWLNPPAIRDADRDGKPEFHGLEPKWWTWSARAYDRSPIKVWTYAGGAVHDVTSSFPAEVQADQTDQYAFFQSSLQTGDVGAARNGMAAYVADGYTLGHGDAALAVLQAAVAAGQLDDPQAGNSTSDYLDKLNELLRSDRYTT